jgi:hypothetical protein
VLEEVEETTRFLRKFVVIVVIFIFLARIMLRQIVLVTLPVNLHRLETRGEHCSGERQPAPTEFLTCSFQSKCSMASVIPFSSGLSPSELAGGEYLYSFFRTVFVKYWFSLKNCVTGQPGVLTAFSTSQTYEFHSEASVVCGISGDPYVLEEAEGGLICAVLNVECKKVIIHECNGPEVLYLLHDGPAFLIDWVQSGQGITLCDYYAFNTIDLLSKTRKKAHLEPSPACFECVELIPTFWLPPR